MVMYVYTNMSCRYLVTHATHRGVSYHLDGETFSKIHSQVHTICMWARKELKSGHPYQLDCGNNKLFVEVGSALGHGEQSFYDVSRKVS
jgi:hypothetical protein